MCTEKLKVQSQRICDSSKFPECHASVSSEHRKLEKRNRNYASCWIITIAGFIVCVVFLRITEFWHKVFERASVNSHEFTDVSQIHRMCIIQHGNTTWMWVSIRSIFFVLFGSVHFGTYTCGKQETLEIDGRKCATKHRARDWSYLSCRLSRAMAKIKRNRLRLWLSANFFYMAVF